MSKEQLDSHITALLTSSVKDILPNLENLSALIAAAPSSVVESSAVKATNTIVGKAFAAACIPQPCQHALGVLTQLGAAIRPEETMVLSNFLHNACHAVLKLLWSSADEFPSLIGPIENFFHVTYEKHRYGRKAVRAALHGALASYTACMSDGAALPHTTIAAILNILIPMYRGLRSPLGNAHIEDMMMVLSPLCRSQKGTAQGGMAATEFYVEILVAAVKCLIGKVDVDRQSDIIVRLFRSLLPGYQDNKLMPSLAVVSSIALLVDELDGDSFAEVHDDLMNVCARACASDFPPLAVKGLKLWRHEGFVTLAKRWSGDTLRHMAGALHRGTEVHWDRDTRALLLEVWDQLDREWRDESSDAVALPFSHNVAALHYNGDMEPVAAFIATMRERVQIDVEQKKSLDAARRERNSFANITAAVRNASRQLNFVFGKTLGSGAFGTVRYAKYIEPAVDQSLWYEVAIKQVSKAVVREQDCTDAIKREMNIYGALTAASNGTLIAPLYHVFEDASYFYMVTEFCKGGDLFDGVLSGSEQGKRSLHSVVTSTGAAVAPTSHAFAQHRAWVIRSLTQVGNALSLIHRLGYFYGDVKPENVLIQSSGNVALCDFGAVMSLADVSATRKFSGTLEYCAPELLRALTLAHSTRADVSPISGEKAEAWSFGCLCVQLTTGHLPHHADSPGELLASIVEGGDDNDWMRCLPPVLRRLLCVDPCRRMTIDEALQDEWFTQPSDVVVRAPPSVEGSAAHVSRHSGRKESMMWKRINIAAIKVQSAWNQQLTLDEESDDDASRQVSFQVRDVLPASAGRSGGFSAPGSVTQYFTVMPGRR